MMPAVGATELKIIVGHAAGRANQAGIGPELRWGQPGGAEFENNPKTVVLEGILDSVSADAFLLYTRKAR